MAYNDETAKAKLSQLNESQDSIMATGSWFMFFRRYASPISRIWASQLRSVQPNKRLNLIYVVNEVVQKERNKGRDEYTKAFSPIIGDAVVEAYTSNNSEIKGKLKRVVGVWGERNVFTPDVQNDIEKRISDVDKGRGAKGKLGGSLFAASSGDGSVPAELKEIVNLQTNLSRSSLESASMQRSASNEYTNTKSGIAVEKPSLAVQVARLNALTKSLDSTHSSLQTTLAARDALIAGLEKVVEENRAAREEEVTKQQDLDTKRQEIEQRKEVLDDAIAKGLSPEDVALPEDEDIPRPEMEPLTPPPAESLTPPPAPAPETMPFAVDGVDDDGAKTPPGTPPPSVMPTPNYAVGDPRRRTTPKPELDAPATPPLADPADLNTAPAADPSSMGVLSGAGIKRDADPSEQGRPNGLSNADPRRRNYEIKRRKTSNEDGEVAAPLPGLDEDALGGLG